MQKSVGQIGKIVGGALYVHRSAVDHLHPDQADRIRRAAALASDRRWNVGKIDLRGGAAVSLMDYEDFSEAHFPALRESHRVDLETGAISSRRYGDENPPILHRKELLLAPDAPDRARFSALTSALEDRGLFIDMAKRGRKRPWEEALQGVALRVENHALVEAGHEEAYDERISKLVNCDEQLTVEVQRHRTAIARDGLSAPMAALHRAGFLEDGNTVLDYGCGRGDDVRALAAAGIDAIGWDPHYAPDDKVLKPRELVNLGFVLNVIDDPEARREALRRAFDLTSKCLSVAVMLTGKGDVSGLRPYKDGYLTSRGTFQKYFTQAEIRDFIANTLDVTPVAAGPGIFLAFRDEDLEQRYLSRRQLGFTTFRPIPSAPRPPSERDLRATERLKALSAAHEDMRRLLLDLGRAPHATELPDQLRATLLAARISVNSAISAAVAAMPQEEMSAATDRRIDEVTRFFALQAFSGRAVYKKLAPELQRDVRAFFGTVKSAEAGGREMLFSAGDIEALAQEAALHDAEGLGYLVDDKYQVHGRDLDRLSSRLRTYIGIAQTLAGALDDAPIYRVHLRSRKLTTLVYLKHCGRAKRALIHGLSRRVGYPHGRRGDSASCAKAISRFNRAVA